MLTPEHKKRRVELDRKWIKVSHPWNLTVSTDEKKFNLDGPDNWSTWVDEDGEIYRNKRQMGGGSLMVWGMIMPSGFIHLERLEGKFNSEKYIEMPSEVIPNLDTLFGKGNYWFQQDNSSIHTSKASTKYFDEAGVRVLEWPARSPEKNEHSSVNQFN